jgi:hypothetical protein
VARKTVVVSDLSGKTIQDGKGAKVRITFEDARSGSIEMDVTSEEGREMGRKGRAGSSKGAQAKGLLAFNVNKLSSVTTICAAPGSSPT